MSLICRVSSLIWSARYARYVNRPSRGSKVFTIVSRRKMDALTMNTDRKHAVKISSPSKETNRQANLQR